MKIAKVNLILSLLFVAVVSFSFTLPPDEKGEEKADKTTLKAREAVANASPDDWYTYAKSAEKCIKKGVNLKEASDWLDHSIDIKETAYNLELKGDYYKANRLPDKALKYYVKSMQVGKEENTNFDARDIQRKIADIAFN